MPISNDIDRDESARHGGVGAPRRRCYSFPKVAAVTGHKSLREVEHYIQDAAQIGLADAAIATVAPATEVPFLNLVSDTDGGPD
jgi:hypothetical protein